MTSQNLTVRQSCDQFLAVKAGKSAGYQETLKITFGLFCDRLGPMQMRHLNETHLLRVFDHWQTRIEPSTFNVRLGHIRLWLKHAYIRRQTRLHPDVLTGTVSKRRVVPRKRVYLSATQLLGMLDKCVHPRDRAYLALGMYTALRANEIRTLRIEDVDLESRSLHVLRHKTGKRDTLPLTLELENELRRWLTEYTRRVGKLQPHFLLVPAKEKPRVTRRGATVAARAACKLKPETALSPNCRLMHDLLTGMGFNADGEGMHTLRRSTARLAYEHFLSMDECRDEALSMVQELLGHSTQAMTEHYIGAERFREKRDRMLRGKPFLSAMIEDVSNVRKLHAQ